MSQIEDQIQGDAPAYGRPEGRIHEEPPPEPARLGPVQRFFGALFSPGPTFEDVNRKPTWLIPFFITLAAVVAFWIFFAWYFDAQFQKQMRPMIIKQAQDSGNPTPTEQEIASYVFIGKAILVVFMLLWAAVKYFAAAGALAMGMIFLQAQTTFKKILSVVFWSASVTSVLDLVVKIASILSQPSDGVDSGDPATLSATSLAFLLPADASISIKAMASAVDIFSIWFLILLVIGLTSVGGSRKITRKPVGWMVFSLWVVFVLLYGGWAAIAPRQMAAQ